MSFENELDTLFQRWQVLRKAGQIVTAEALCEEEGITSTPSLIAALETLIRYEAPIRRAATVGTVMNMVPGHPKSEEDDDGAQWQTVPEQNSPSISHDSKTCRPHHATRVPESTFHVNREQMDQAPTDDDDIFSVSHFKDFRFIARGGIGEVCQASEQELYRDVALKFIRRDREVTEEARQLFMVEGEITARLEHPGVVPIYGFGTTSDGRLFYVMRFIRGKTLEEQINDFHATASNSNLEHGTHSFEFRKILSCFVSVCNTIAYAHSRGILHRDIKPHNIMLGKYGETLVVDWGLARSFERDDTDRASGEATLMLGSGDNDPEFSEGVVGTPNYMSPEQADGGISVGKPSDIYSLGATLYKLLTGKLAIRGNSVRKTLDKVLRGDYLPPREVKAQVPSALEAICIKAMLLSPSERYDSALELAADVEHYLANERVLAYAEPMSRQIYRWMRKHSLSAQVVAATLLTVLLMTTALLTNTFDHRSRIIVEKLNGLKSKASVEEAVLLRDFRALEGDVRFLVGRPQVITVAAATSLDFVLSERDELVEVFAEFIRRNDGYMQARLIGSDGMERVRVERKKPGGAVRVADRLSDKGKSGYFVDTMKLRPDEVYLSKLELNVEQEKKDYDFPVVRAATAIFGEAEKPLGIVIINMHFSHLTKLVQQSLDTDQLAKSNAQQLMVYLTNHKGEFLLHPVPGIGFCFERDMKYHVDDMYVQLGQFRASSDREVKDVQLTRVKPKCGVLVEPRLNQNSDRESLDQLAALIKADYPDVHSIFSDDETRGILKGIRGHQLQAICNDLKTKYGEMFAIRQLPQRYAEKDQAVYCRKIFFDERKPERFITLVLVLPYE